MKKDGSSTNATAATVGYEAALWQMADALRGSMDAADQDHAVFGMTFWPHLNAQARQPTIGQLVDDATSSIERDAPALKGALPRDYARPALGKSRLRRLIHLIRSTGIGDAFPQVLQTNAVPEVSGVRR